MNKPVTEKAKRLVNTATRVGIVAGVPFYESPTHGDEMPLIYITKAGKAKVSDYWELPDLQEFLDCGPADAFHA